MDKWDIRYLRLAREVASWSKDPSTRVGAIIVDQASRVVSLGLNGLPRYVSDDQRLEDRDIKLATIIHAEANALLFARRDLTGCTCYTWPIPPCSRCASLLIQSGIRRVVSVHPTDAHETRWGLSMTLAKGNLEEAGVTLDLIKPTLLVGGVHA